MSETTLAVAVFLGIIGLVVLLRVVLGSQTAKWKAAAEEFGLVSQDQADASMIARIAEYGFYQAMIKPVILDYMSGTIESAQVALFHIKYSPSQTSRRKGVYFSQTTICFRSDGLELPQFSATPRSMLSGKGSVSIDSSSGFDKAISVWSEDEAATRSVFSPEVQSYLMEHSKSLKGLIVLADGDLVIMYRDGKYVKRKALPDFVKSTSAVFKVLSAG